MYYPINYGYIEGIMAQDGEEQDVYILEVDIPVEKFAGKVITIVHRNDDVKIGDIVNGKDRNSNHNQYVIGRNG